MPTTLETQLKEKGVSAYKIAKNLSKSGYRSAGFIRKKLAGKIPMTIEELESICSFAKIDVKDIKYSMFKLRVE